MLLNIIKVCSFDTNHHTPWLDLNGTALFQRLAIQQGLTVGIRIDNSLRLGRIVEEVVHPFPLGIHTIPQDDGEAVATLDGSNLLPVCRPGNQFFLQLGRGNRTDVGQVSFAIGMFRDAGPLTKEGMIHVGQRLSPLQLQELHPS